VSYVPNPGDIGLVAIRGRVGAAIRLGQWLVGDGFDHYEHAFVYIGGGEIVEAMPNGARRSTVPTTSGPVVYLRCPPALGPAVAQAALGFIGVPYSFVDYAAIALHRFRIPTPRLRRYIESSKRLICSAMCDRAAHIGGWKIFDDGRWFGHVTPGDLYRVYAAQNK
jgi:hypothetical protein